MAKTPPSHPTPLPPPQLEDSIEAIVSLSEAEFLARIDDIRMLSPRPRAFAARRWARLVYPDDDAEAHKKEALDKFSPLMRSRQEFLHHAKLILGAEERTPDSNWPTYIIIALCLAVVIGTILWAL